MDWWLLADVYWHGVDMGGYMCWLSLFPGNIKWIQVHMSTWKSTQRNEERREWPMSRQNYHIGVKGHEITHLTCALRNIYIDILLWLLSLCLYSVAYEIKRLLSVNEDVISEWHTMDGILKMVSVDFNGWGGVSGGEQHDREKGRLARG